MFLTFQHILVGAGRWEPREHVGYSVIATCYKRLLRLVRKARTADDMPVDVVRRLQRDQLNGWLKVAFLNVPVGIVVASSLYGTLWNQRGNHWLQASYAGIMASYAALLTLSWAWTRHTEDSFDVTIRMRLFLAVRFVMGSFWSFGLVAMGAVTDAQGHAILLAVAIALMSTPVFTGPVLFALAGWIPATAGCFGLLFASGTLMGTGPLICAIAYATLTYSAILAVDRQVRERVSNLLSLEHHAETIGLLLRDFEESSSDWLWETDAGLTLRHISSRFAEVAQRPASAMEINLFELVSDTAPTEADLPEAIRTMRDQMAARAAFRELVIPVRLGGDQRWWALTGKPRFGSDGRFIGYRGVGADVTVVHRSRERLSYLARHDTLTGLANRAEFNDALATALALCGQQRVALICLDLDEFKAINDTYGHDVGDTVLRTVGQRMRGALRPQDIAARLGGDEFAIILDVADRQQAILVVQRIVNSLDAPFICGDLTIRVGVSVGVALAPDDGNDPDQLYRNADVALYRAKSSGRGAYWMFDVTMDCQVHDQRLLQRDLRDALPNGELFVVYQPIIDLSTRRIISLEALARWRHPRRGIVPPAEFIPIAEQSGQIAAIGGFVLAEAASLAARLPPHLRVAVNLSASQLRDDGLMLYVRDVLDRFSVRSQRIEFEITESVMLDNDSRALETLQALRTQGHRLTIDDFGTGYSSLSVLRSFAFDQLKIDRSFITDLDSDNSPIVRAVIDLARALGISVVAEGVETEQHASILQRYRCASAQGYYFSLPLTPAEALQVIGAVPDHGAANRVTLPATVLCDAGRQPMMTRVEVVQLSETPFRIM